MKSLRPSAALAAAATALLALPALSGAAQSANVGYQCKFPLSNAKSVELAVKIDLPATARVDQQIPASTLKTKITIHDLGSTIDAVPSIAAVRGTVTTSTTIAAPGGFIVPAVIPTTVGRTPVRRPGSNLITGNLSAVFPSLTFGDAGKATFSLTGLTANLTALDSAGVPVILPRVTTDPAGNPTPDSDGNPETFDVRCNPAPGASTKYATITVRR